jgi:hypothetical protein
MTDFVEGQAIRYGDVCMTCWGIGGWPKPCPGCGEIRKPASVPDEDEDQGC